MLRNIPYPTIGTFLALWIPIMFLSAWLLHWAVIRDVNNLFFDRLSTGAQRNDIVIIGIDDASLQKIGAWPWERSVHAKLLTELEKYNPRAVAFDVLFVDPRARDEEMVQALERASFPVVLASKFEESGYIQPLYTILNKNVRTGAVNVGPDVDSKVRSYQKYFNADGECVPSLSQALIQSEILVECDTSMHTLRYQPQVKKVSYSDVLEGVVPASALRDSFVLIGYATADLEVDSFAGLFGSKINGVEIHASALATTLNDVPSVVFSTYLVLFTNIILALFFAVLPFIFRRASVQLIILGIVSISVVFVAVLAYEYGYKTYMPWAIGLPIISYMFSLLYSYIVGAQRNEYLKKVFGTYVHPSLLEELIANPKKLKLGGEKRRMTVLFSDVRGFTSFSEKMSPEELVDLLNDYLNTMSPLILEKRGTIDKYIGDAIMAFWNAPVLTPNHELVAVETALQMQEALVHFNQKLQRADGLTLGIGIGINTGDMVVGNMGSDARFNYTVMGDAVNTGSRFEGLTKKYGVVTIVGESTKNAVSTHDILFRTLDIMTVKGKSDPTTIYEPLRASESMRAFVAKYEEGFRAYVRGDFQLALQLLGPLASQGDGPAQVLLDRMKTIDVNTWKGVWKWDEK